MNRYLINDYRLKVHPLGQEWRSNLVKWLVQYLAPWKKYPQSTNNRFRVRIYSAYLNPTHHTQIRSMISTMEMRITRISLKMTTWQTHKLSYVRLKLFPRRVDYCKQKRALYIQYFSMIFVIKPDQWIEQMRSSVFSVQELPILWLSTAIMSKLADCEYTFIVCDRRVILDSSLPFCDRDK